MTLLELQETLAQKDIRLTSLGQSKDTRLWGATCAKWRRGGRIVDGFGTSSGHQTIEAAILEAIRLCETPFVYESKPKPSFALELDLGELEL